MADTDKTPLLSRSQGTDMERYILEQMGVMVDTMRKDLGDKMDRNHTLSITTATELKAHVSECGKRYSELQQSNVAASASRAAIKTEVLNVGWLIRLRTKLFEKAIDWCMYSAILAGIFLYKHGWVPPLPH